MYSEIFKINIIKARLHHRETVSGSVKKKWQKKSTGNFSKEVPEFLRGHRRLYSTAFTEQPVKEKELAV